MRYKKEGIYIYGPILTAKTQVRVINGDVRLLNPRVSEAFTIKEENKVNESCPLAAACNKRLSREIC